MDSKKLGMFAAAALTVLASQANAKEVKKAAKATTAKGEMVCANTCGGVSGSGCGGKVLVEKGSKDKAACEKAKGKWMAKDEFLKGQTAAKDSTGAEDSHTHK